MNHLHLKNNPSIVMNLLHSVRKNEATIDTYREIEIISQIIQWLP